MVEEGKDQEGHGEGEGKMGEKGGGSGEASGGREMSKIGLECYHDWY